MSYSYTSTGEIVTETHLIEGTSFAGLRTRILMWTEEEGRLGALPPKAGNILEAVLYRGELPRGDVADLLGTTARHARSIVATPIGHGALASESPRAPLRLAFPAALAPRWMPGLFPERTS